MKRTFYAFAMCQSMFCAIPSPFHQWDEGARSRMLVMLPIIGLEIGLLWVGLAYLCQYFALPALVMGLILAAYPFLVTGSIHLDGFMDVTDAIKSCRNLERRREILKDPHVGSFAVLGCVLLMLAQFSFLASLPEKVNLWIFLLIPAFSRCCSALAVLCLPPMSTSQYVNRERSTASVVVLSLLLCAILAGGFLLCGIYGFALIGGLVGHLLALQKGYRSLKGMNGDISGYALTLSELVSIAVVTLI